MKTDGKRNFTDHGAACNKQLRMKGCLSSNSQRAVSMNTAAQLTINRTYKTSILETIVNTPLNNKTIDKYA